MLVLVQARFASGSHELYQLLISFVPESEVAEDRAIVSGSGRAAVDAVAEPELARDLLRLIDAEALIDTEEGCFRFQRVERSGPVSLEGPARTIGVEQSNSSVVFGDDTIVKVFRRLEPGSTPSSSCCAS